MSEVTIEYQGSSIAVSALAQMIREEGAEVS